MRIAIGSDHAGFPMKEIIKEYLRSLGHEVLDMGTHSAQSVNYAEFAEKVAREVASGRAQRGILICGTGIGMAIAANKVGGIRAALVHSEYTAKMAAMHNNANIITFGGRVEGPQEAKIFVKIWLETPFEGGRHNKRLEKITEMEEKCKEG